ncbi:MAG: hypothetical protein K5841_05785 [Fretibacterium sp.]|nr:hypothetical protein [Fretibacterium sp.]
MSAQTFCGEGGGTPPPRVFPLFVLPVFAKLNLTLRVTGRRENGYHDLVSLFLRIPSGETLFVSPLPPDSPEDQVVVRGIDLRITGENIVSRALRLARAGAQIPPLKVEISKALYPGSGLGSGSGNAAAILRWLAPRYPQLPWQDIARRTGADVPFLFSALPAAQVTGVGDQLKQLPSLTLSGVVAFPEWDVGTGNAYAELDSAYKDGYPLGESQAEGELVQIHRCLSEGRRAGFCTVIAPYPGDGNGSKRTSGPCGAGLLPNDFLPPLVAAHPQYQELFTLFEEARAMGWGITGSGGAAFALFERGIAPELMWPAWVRQVLCFNL